MSRPLRIAGYVGIGIAAGVLVAVMVILLLTRTDWGMERARRFAVAWLDDRIHGELRLSRISGPNLLGGVTIHDFAIIDPRGRPFVYADSLQLGYNWRSLLRGQIVLDRVALYQPDLNIERLPGDTAWNYEYVFADTTPDVGPPRGRSLILFQDARVYNGVATVRLPFEPDGPVTPEDTARVILEAVPGGTARAMRFTDVNARLNRVLWESPVEEGQLFDIAALSARGFIWRDPFVIQNAHGTLTARDTVLAFDFKDVTLPGSQADVLGRVIMQTGRNDIDVRVDGRRVQFRDMQWLYPRLPDEGGGSVVLRIQTQPRGILFLAEDARLQAPGTRVAGTFGVVAGDTMYFTRVDLRASPLDVRLLEQILPGGLPVEGLLIGTVEVRGPLSALETSGDLQLAGGGVGSGSHVAWRGVLDVRNGEVVARSMRADVTRLELALLSAFNSSLDLDGTVTGRVQGSGSLDRLVFQASLLHEGASGATSTFDGGGSVTRAGVDHAVDLTVNAAPVSFADLAAYVPALQAWVGGVRGPVHLAGTARDLRFDARLVTGGGPLALDGRVLLGGAERRVIATARAEGFRLAGLQPGLPEVLLTGTLDVDVTGSDVATSTGTARLALDSARLRDLPLGHGAVGGQLGAGLFTVDSARFNGLSGVGLASGALGLTAETPGVLQLGFVSHSLTPLEPYLLGESDTAPDEDPRVAGRIDAAGTVSGWIGGLDVAAQLHGEELVYGSHRAGRLRAEFGMSGIASGATSPFQLTATADSTVLLSHPVRRVQLEAAGLPHALAVSVRGTQRGAEQLHVEGTIERDSAGTSLRLEQGRFGAAAPWLLAAPATTRIADGVIRLDGIELQRAAGGSARAAGVLAWGAAGATSPLDFTVQLSALPFTEVQRLMRSTSEGAGRFDGGFRVSGTAADPIIEGELNGQDLRYGDVRIDRAYAELNYSALGLDAHAEAQHAGRSILTGGGRIPLDLRLMPVDERRLDEPLRFTIAADSLPLALPLNVLDGFGNIDGRIDGLVALGGTARAPALSGGLRLAGGSADWDVSGVRYRDVNGSFTIERDRLLRIHLTAGAGDPRPRGVRPLTIGGAGTGTISGTLDLAELTNPGFDLRLSADRVFAARRRDVEATVTGEILLGGHYRAPDISGAVRVDQGALYIDEIYRQYLIVGLEDLAAVDTSIVTITPVLGNLIASASNPFLKYMWVRNMQVRVGSDTWLRSRDMDVEVSGDLAVTFNRRADDVDLRLTGSLNVERGTYTLYYPPLQSRRFNVRDGTIEFTGTPGIDPNLAITAAYRARRQGEPLDVLAVVNGTLQNPRVRLTSDQSSISESDLASYLFFGVPTWEVAGGGFSASNVRGLGGRALAPSVLGYASSGLQSLVQSVGLLDYAALTSAEVAHDNRANGALSSFLAGTQLELGSYVFGTSNIFVGYSQRLGTANIDPAVRLEWRFLPEFTFEMFAEDRFARVPGFGLRSEAGLRKVYGFTLFREWGF